MIFKRLKYFSMKLQKDYVDVPRYNNKSLSIVHVQCQMRCLQFPLKHDAFLIRKGMFTFFCEAQGKISQQSGLGKIQTF